MRPFAVYWLLLLTSVPALAQPFKSVQIGNQVWMVDNISAGTFLNGDPIPQALSAEDWAAAGRKRKSAWCYYDSDSTQGLRFGKLYNWYAVNDPRGICPTGWHMPRIEDWKILIFHLGGDAAAGQKLKAENGWIVPPEVPSGFSGLPGGSRYNKGRFAGLGEDGNWWSSTYDRKGNRWAQGLILGHGYAYAYYYGKNNGLSVRCLRDY